MVGQKVHDYRLSVIAHAMQLNPLMVVNVHILCLSNCKHLMVLQEAHITHFVLGLELHN